MVFCGFCAGGEGCPCFICLLVLLDLIHRKLQSVGAALSWDCRQYLLATSKISTVWNTLILCFWTRTRTVGYNSWWVLLHLWFYNFYISLHDHQLEKPQVCSDVSLGCQAEDNDFPYPELTLVTKESYTIQYQLIFNSFWFQECIQIFF